MAKTRVTLTLEPDEDAAVRAAAEEEELDLSAFLRVAALAEVARIKRTNAAFAEIDRLSRSAEEATALEDTEGGEALAAASPADDAAMDAYLDAIDRGVTRRRGGSAA
jgi:uncharacterized protein (DUF1778 family)